MKKFALITMFALAACGGKKEPAGGSGSAPTPVTTGSESGSAPEPTPGSAAEPATGSAATADDVDVPTEQDFEAEAAAKITDKTLDEQVKALEAELGDGGSGHGVEQGSGPGGQHGETHQAANLAAAPQPSRR